MICNCFSNRIEITYSIHKHLYFLIRYNHRELLSASKIFISCLTLISTRLSNRNYQYSDCIGFRFFLLLSIAEIFLTLPFFVSWFIIIGTDNSFFPLALISNTGQKNFIFFREIRNRKLSSSTQFERGFRLLIQVWLEFFCEQYQTIFGIWRVWLLVDFTLHQPVQSSKK